MEPLGLQPKSRQQRLFAGGARFRASGAAHSEFAQTLEGIPAVIAQAKTNLKHSPKIHTETAIEQAQGAISLVREGLSPLLNQAPQVAKDLGPIQEKTAKALEDYKTWLQKDLLPRSDGDFRLGADKFRKKLRFALASDLSMEEIMQRAQADLAQTQKARVAQPSISKTTITPSSPLAARQ